MPSHKPNIFFLEFFLCLLLVVLFGGDSDQFYWQIHSRLQLLCKPSTTCNISAESLTENLKPGILNLRYSNLRLKYFHFLRKILERIWFVSFLHTITVLSPCFQLLYYSDGFYWENVFLIRCCFYTLRVQKSNASLWIESKYVTHCV